MEQKGSRQANPAMLGANVITDVVRQVIGGRDKLDRISAKRLKKFENHEIERLWTIRTPIQSGLTNTLNLLTRGKFNKELLKSGHDALFHLKAVVNLKGSNIYLTIEKNETVKISRVPTLPKGERREINVNPGLTVGTAYDNTISGYPNAKTAYGYDSITNNCQRFVKMFLTRNPLIKQTAEDVKFVTQDLKWLIDNFPAVGPLAKLFTDIGHRIGVVLTGGRSAKQLSKAGQSNSAKLRSNKKKSNTKIYIKMKGDGIVQDVKDKIKSIDIMDIKAKTEKQARAMITKKVKAMLKAKGEKINKTELLNKITGLVKKWVLKFKGQKGKGVCASKQRDEDDFTCVAVAPTPKQVEKKRNDAEQAMKDILVETGLMEDRVLPIHAFIPRNKKKMKQKGGAVALPQAIGRAGNPFFSGKPMPQVRNEVVLGPITSVGEGIMKMRRIRGRRYNK